MATSSECWLAQSAQPCRARLGKGLQDCLGLSASRGSVTCEMEVLEVVQHAIFLRKLYIKSKVQQRNVVQNKYIYVIHGATETHTSEEAGRKPKPSGALSSSLHPFTPGLKCNSTWKRSSEEGSYRHTCQHTKEATKLSTKSWCHISYLVIVLIQHNNNLCHIVEFGYSAEVVHSLLPLFIFLLLNRHR